MFMSFFTTSLKISNSDEKSSSLVVRASLRGKTSMKERNKIFLHLSTLITKARLKQGFATLRELYREKNPSVDYNTWLHSESGRRIPPIPVIQEIVNILQIDKRDILIAYCKDKFHGPDYQQALDLFEHNQFANIDALLEARDHERSGEFVFTAEQVRAFQGDTRLRLFLTFTYDRTLKTTFDRLATFFQMKKSAVKEIVARLEKLRLVEVIDEEVRRIYTHTNFPNNIDVSEMRRILLSKSLEFTLNSNSHITNYFVNITPESYKKVLGFFNFVEANLTKLDKDERKKVNSKFFQITITSSQILEGRDDDDK